MKNQLVANRSVCVIKVSRPICGLFQGEVCLCYYLYTPLWPALFILLLNLIESGRERKKDRKKENFKGPAVEERQWKPGLDQEVDSNSIS